MTNSNQDEPHDRHGNVGGLARRQYHSRVMFSRALVRVEFPQLVDLRKRFCFHGVDQRVSLPLVVRGTR